MEHPNNAQDKIFFFLQNIYTSLKIKYKGVQILSSLIWGLTYLVSTRTSSDFQYNINLVLTIEGPFQLQLENAEQSKKLLMLGSSPTDIELLSKSSCLSVSIGFLAHAGYLYKGPRQDFQIVDAPALDFKKLWILATYGTQAIKAPVITNQLIKHISSFRLKGKLCYFLAGI